MHGWQLPLGAVMSRKKSFSSSSRRRGENRNRVILSASGWFACVNFSSSLSSRLKSGKDFCRGRPLWWPLKLAGQWLTTYESWGAFVWFHCVSFDILDESWETVLGGRRMLKFLVREITRKKVFVRFWIGFTHLRNGGPLELASPIFK